MQIVHLRCHFIWNILVLEARTAANSNEVLTPWLPQRHGMGWQLCWVMAHPEIFDMIHYPSKGSGAAVLRVLRLVRVFRVLTLGAH